MRSEHKLSNLNNDQFQALNVVFNAIVNSDDKFVVISGSAGVGKTYLIKKIQETLSDITLFPSIYTCCLTGKAASLLPHGRTLHSLLYRTEIDYSAPTGQQIKFVLNDPSTYDEKTLFIVDEASMVPTEMINYFMETGSKVIFFGDTKQLPPIHKDQINILDWSDYELTQIMRTKQDDPIVNLAYSAYNRNVIDKRYCKENIKLFGENYRLGKILTENEYDIVLCGTNNKRKKINQLMRQIKGYESERPEKGERIICLKNMITNEASKHMIYNGQILEVSKVRKGTKDGDFYTLFDDMNMRTYHDIFIKHKYFDGDFNKPVDYEDNAFTYGYAITVHKAQGDQFERVLFVDEDVSYFLPRNRFRYTAITRAMETLHIKEE